MELRRRRVRAPRGLWGSVSAAALFVWLADALPACAQDNVVGTATLPRDLSPWGMFLNADPVVKAVLVGLAFASLVTWTVWLAKSIEIFFAKRRVRAAAKELAGIRSLDKVPQFAEIQGEVAQLLGAAATELKLSPGLADNDGIKERIASRLVPMKLFMMPQTVPNRPTKGAVAPMVASTRCRAACAARSSLPISRWSRRGSPRRCSRPLSGSPPR